MILAVDIGNTNIVVGCIKGEEICFVERMSTESTRTELEYESWECLADGQECP